MLSSQHLSQSILGDHDERGGLAKSKGPFAETAHGPGSGLKLYGFVNGGL
jgi:hypothetical protein